MSTPLSARAVKCASTQAMSMVKAALKRRQRDLAWLRKLGESPAPKVLARRLAQPLTKPDASTVKAELNSICARIEWQTESSFDGWCVLSSLGKSFGKLQIPLKRNRHINKLMAGTQLPSILLTDDGVDIRFSREQPPKQTGRPVGGDTGLKTVLTLSNGQTTPEKNAHGHSLVSICGKLSRKRKGSKAFSKTAAHRTNFINWSINQLNLDDISELRLEKVVNIRYGQHASRRMQAWTNPDIQRKVLSLMEERNVSVILQPSAYRSQRCSGCGNVRHANRKGKIYSCKRCGFVCDADLNAALNHEQNLPPIPTAYFRTKKNLGDGFLWTASGCFPLSGVEFAVPPSLQLVGA